MYGAPPRFAQAEQTGKAESTKDLTRCDNLGAPWAQDPRVSGVERWISSSRRGAEPITDGHLLFRGRRWHLAQHGCMKRTPYLHWGLHFGDPATRYRFRRPSLADECRSTADGPPPNTPAGGTCWRGKRGSPTRVLGRGGRLESGNSSRGVTSYQSVGTGSPRHSTERAGHPATKNTFKVAARAGHGRRRRALAKSLEESECQDLDATLLRTLRAGGGADHPEVGRTPLLPSQKRCGKGSSRRVGCVVARGTTNDSADPDDPNDPDPPMLQVDSGASLGRVSPVSEMGRRPGAFAAAHPSTPSSRYTRGAESNDGNPKSGQAGQPAAPPNEGQKLRCRVRVRV